MEPDVREAIEALRLATELQMRLIDAEKEAVDRRFDDVDNILDVLIEDSRVFRRDVRLELKRIRETLGDE